MIVVIFAHPYRVVNDTLASVASIEEIIRDLQNCRAIYNICYLPLPRLPFRFKPSPFPKQPVSVLSLGIAVDWRGLQKEADQHDDNGRRNRDR